MYEHHTARAWHTLFTLVFLCLFSFLFYVNAGYSSLIFTPSRYYLNPANAMQRWFEAERLGKIVETDMVDLTYVLGIIIIISHFLFLADLSEPSITDAPTALLSYFVARRLAKYSIVEADRKAVVGNAEDKMWAWLQPPARDNPRPAISIWYLIESYHQSEFLHNTLPTRRAQLRHRKGRDRSMVWGTESF
jgi:hypothetical protein